MAKLTQREFAHLVRTAPEGATEDDIIQTAKQLEQVPEGERKSVLQRAWEWFNTPLVDLPHSESEHPHARIANFVSDVLEGFTSPAGITATVLSGGGYALGRLGAATASRALQAAEGALNLPYIAEGMKNIVQGIREGDAAQGVTGAIEAGLGTLGVRSAARRPLSPNTIPRSAQAIPDAAPAGGNAGRALSAFEDYDRLLDPERSPLLSGEPYAILTAANPEGQVLDAAANAARQQQLLADIEARGLRAIPQQGVYGGAPEPSFLVPGMDATTAKELGRKYGQQAVISAEGWHRLADDATFPRIGGTLDQTVDDFYSEVALPSGQKVRYQLHFPDEAFEPPASAGNVDVAPSTSGASLNGNTVAAVAAPAAAGLVPDDPESTLDDALRIGLMGAGAAGMAARFLPRRIKQELDDVVSRKIAELKAQGIEDPIKSKNAEIHTAVRQHIRSIARTPEEAQTLEHGYFTIELPTYEGINYDVKRPIARILKKGKSGGAELSEWSRRRVQKAYEIGKNSGGWGDSRWLYHASGGDPEVAVQFTRLLGAFSPGQKTHANALNAVEAFIRSASGESPDAILSSMLHGHPRPSTVRDNLVRAIQGGRIFQDKVEALAGAELGIHDKIPIDMWLLRALGANTDKTPPKNAYRLIAQAITREAEKVGESPFSYMAKVWMGMQRIAGAPTPSFSEGFASLRLSGPLTDPQARREFMESFETHKADAFAAARGQVVEGEVMPLALAPRMPYEQWLQEAQALFRAGIEAGDVLGKQRIPKTERPPDLDRLRKGRRQVA